MEGVENGEGKMATTTERYTGGGSQKKFSHTTWDVLGHTLLCTGQPGWVEDLVGTSTAVESYIKQWKRRKCGSGNTLDLPQQSRAWEGRGGGGGGKYKEEAIRACMSIFPFAFSRPSGQAK